MPPTTPIQLIVGLGNPGSQYAQTRHNAGVWLIEALAKECHTSLQHDAKLFGHVGKIQLNNQECRLLVPSTFMNLSGKAVLAMCQFYKIPLEAVLVVHDELDLPTGQVKLKFAGGHAGHNGLRDIMQKFGSADFWRLRLGIDHPRNYNLKIEVGDYVLQRITNTETTLITQAIDKSLAIMPALLNGKFDKAMQELHTS